VSRTTRADLPPGPRVPGSLQIVATWTRPTASLERMRQRYGKRITVQLPFQPPFVILSDPGEIKQLFTSPPDVLHPGEGARILEPILGKNSVILLDEEPHMEQRKLLLPAFHGQKMARLTGLMTELAEREIETWPAGEPVRLHPRLQRLTLEIILRAVFGLAEGSRLTELRDLLTEILAFAENPLSILPALQRVARVLPAMRRFETAIQRVDELIFALIEEHSPDGDDVLAMLLQTSMSPQEIRDELMTAVVAGHETTASELAWAFEQLARHPQAQTGLRGDDEYLNATINEVLRRKPVVPNAEPRLTKQPVTIGGFTYPAGVALLASAFLVHHDPTIYPDPYAFRPERFIGVQPGTYTWIPFGGGRRRCLGASFALQEMRIVLRAVAERYWVSPADPAPERTARRSITFSPAKGATVVLSEQRVDALAAGHRERPGAQAALAGAAAAD